MQMNPGKYSGPINCLTVIYRSTGLKGWYLGTTPFMIQSALCFFVGGAR